VLHAISPLTLVHRTVGPMHLSVAVSPISLILALVLVARLPREHPFPMFHIILKVALILVTFLLGSFLPFTESIFATIFELARVDRTISPLVLTLAGWLPLIILSHKTVAVLE